MVIFVHRSTVTITCETAVFDDIGTSGLKVLRRYRPRCGSPLTTEPDLTPEFFMVKAGTIDSNQWSRSLWELFVGAAQALGKSGSRRQAIRRQS
jgi:hypothetical protein